jgi:rubrerythrin
MKKEMSLADVLTMAVQREQEAFFFYTDLIELASDKNVKETMQWIAGEELKHRRFLVDYQSGKHGAAALKMSAVIDYKLADYLAEPEADKPLNSADIYLVASHREKRSHAFYSGLAAMHSDPEIKDLLTRMANEELKHKEKMEYLYSNTAFAQTAGG